MPIYDYLCSACDHRADILHGIHDPAPQFCPSCGADGTMRKQFAAPAIHFKGSGWAKKDRGASTRTRAAAKAAGEGGGQDGSDGGGASSTAGSGGSEGSDPSSSGTSSSGSTDASGSSSSGPSSSPSSSSDTPKPSTTD